jgi:hypothetical protein
VESEAQKGAPNGDAYFRLALLARTVQAPAEPAMSELERLLGLSVELSKCSPELRRYVQHLEGIVREVGLQRLKADLQQDEANWAASEKPALLRRQI